MTIQGQRVTARTGIKCVGNTVVLHGIPYAPPYVVTAIEVQARLEAALEASGPLATYRQYATMYRLGYAQQRVPSVSMPAYAGSVDRAAMPARGGETMGRMARILVIDNYDSFVYNLVQYLAQIGAEVDVWRNDDPRFGEAGWSDAYDGILLSPGPGTPEAAGDDAWTSSAARAAHFTDLRGVPGAAVDLGGVRGRGEPRARAAARQDLRGLPRRPGGVFEGSRAR